MTDISMIILDVTGGSEVKIKSNRSFYEQINSAGRQPCTNKHNMRLLSEDLEKHG